MKSSRAFQYVIGLLLVIVCVALSITVLVRPPSEAAGPRVVDDVESTGKIRFLIEECAFVCTQATQLDSESPPEDYAKVRAALVAIDESTGRLLKQLPKKSETWIPVKEAEVLLQDAQKLARMTLEKIPLSPVPKVVAAEADIGETDKEKVGFTEEAKATLGIELTRLEEEALELRAKVERTVIMTSLSRETIKGFETKYILLALLLLASTIACLTIHRASRVVSIPPEKSLESQLKLKARVNPAQAIEGCYDQSRKMLKVADEIFTKSKLTKTGTNTVQASQGGTPDES